MGTQLLDGGARKLLTGEDSKHDPALAGSLGTATVQRRPASGTWPVPLPLKEEESKKKLLGGRQRKTNKAAPPTKRRGGEARVTKTSLALFVALIAGLVLRIFARCLVRLQNRGTEANVLARSAGSGARRLAGPPLEETPDPEKECATEAADALSSLAGTRAHEGTWAWEAGGAGTFKRRGKGVAETGTPTRSSREVAETGTLRRQSLGRGEAEDARLKLMHERMVLKFVDGIAVPDPTKHNPSRPPHPAEAGLPFSGRRHYRLRLLHGLRRVNVRIRTLEGLASWLDPLQQPLREVEGELDPAESAAVELNVEKLTARETGLPDTHRAGEEAGAESKLGIAHAKGKERRAESDLPRASLAEGEDAAGAESDKGTPGSRNKARREGRDSGTLPAEKEATGVASGIEITITAEDATKEGGLDTAHSATASGAPRRKKVHFRDVSALLQRLLFGKNQHKEHVAARDASPPYLAKSSADKPQVVESAEVKVQRSGSRRGSKKRSLKKRNGS